LLQVLVVTCVVVVVTSLQPKGCLALLALQQLDLQETLVMRACLAQQPSSRQM
jgi:hypothetical protein